MHFQSLDTFLVLDFHLYTVDMHRTHRSSIIRIVCMVYRMYLAYNCAYIYIYIYIYIHMYVCNVMYCTVM